MSKTEFFRERPRLQQTRKRNRPVDFTGQVAKLIDLVDYQEATVVSRTLMQNKSSTVTLFAFDEGQGLSEHTVPFDALVNVLEGEAKITISDNAMRVQAGDIVIMPAQQPHALRAVTRFKMILIMIRESS
ncbi:MAG: cupin domain-containing protein [bacterium]